MKSTGNYVDKQSLQNKGTNTRQLDGRPPLESVHYRVVLCVYQHQAPRVNFDVQLPG